MKKFRSLVIALALLFSVQPNVLAAPSLLDTLSGTWDDLDSFITLGQCSSAPSSAGLYLCSPAQLAYVKKGRFEASGFVSATDSVLSIADTLRKEEINTGDVSKLFSSYNYSEFLVSSRVSYVSSHFMMGVRPVRLQGQFQVHNPNLPLGSLTYRDDLTLFAGTGASLEYRNFLFSAGVGGTLLYRKEVLSEATLVSFASRPVSELLKKQNMTGGFLDFGANVELPNYFSVSGTIKDVGQFWKGKDRSGDFLFILPDRIPRFFLSAAAIPSVWIGNIQAGAELIGFFDRENTWDKQWFGTLSYYIGPLRVLSGFRPNLLRTGIALRFSNFEVAVAQEWINKLETGREAQPRFTLGVSAGL